MLSVQMQVKKLAEWRLIKLQRQAVDLEDEWQRLTGFIEREAPLPALCSIHAIKRLAAITQSLAMLKTENDRQRSVLLQECQRLRRAEKAAETVAIGEHAKMISCQIEELTDIAVPRMAQGSNKVVNS
ncbi:MAG TPA: hypothetical protein VFG05_01365 [Methylocella sp.]|nr:hypothetical protein [Methylocella sp.]